MNRHLRIILILCLAIFAYQHAFGHGMSDGDKQLMLTGGYLEYIWLGASHMVTGYDHLLFIFGVIFFLTRFMDIVKFITAFTLGHSITLIFATFMGITANYYLVDAVIALTVVYKGFDNLDGFKKYLGINAPNLMVLVFTFGLIHGFGLSTRLQQLPLNHDELLAQILLFNVGVELGQIVALSVMLIILSGWRKTDSFKKFSNAANVGLMVAGLALLVMQLGGYFGFIHDDHGDDHHPAPGPVHQHQGHGDHGHDHGDTGDSHSHGGHDHSH